MAINLFPIQTFCNVIAHFFPALPPSAQIKGVFGFTYLKFVKFSGIEIPLS